MPWFSYHGAHSGQFCRHAKGDLERVVRAAIERGFTHYGLSEHCPRDRLEDLFPDEADLTPADLQRHFSDYVAEALQLRERHADEIELLIGFETEQLPPETWAERMRQLRSSAPFDYVVGSVHHVDGQCIDFSAEQTRSIAETHGGIETLQIRYFESVTELVETLQPEVVGHIDLIRKFDGAEAGFSTRVMGTVEKALAAVEATGGVLDVNSGAFRRGLSPVYPLPSILERAHHMGIPVTLGDDGHGAHDVGVGLEACKDAIARAGYREVHYLARGADGVAWRSAPLADVTPRA